MKLTSIMWLLHHMHGMHGNVTTSHGRVQKKGQCCVMHVPVQSMKLLWQILLMTESNNNPCFTCSLNCVCVSDKTEPPSIPALLYSLFCYHKVDICPWFGYNHSVVDIGFNYNLYMWYAWTACSTNVLCICYHSWYPDPLCRHLIPPSACIKQLFLTDCHKNYHSYM